MNELDDRCDLCLVEARSASLYDWPETLADMCQEATHYVVDPFHESVKLCGRHLYRWKKFGPATPQVRIYKRRIRN
jgi:hypothetical protein